MKTKLLKKVRKRYVIEYITRVDNINHWLYGEVTKNKPIYQLHDTTSLHRFYAYEKYNDAYNKLLAMIKRDYQHTKKKKPILKSKKVWYNQ